MQLLDPLLLLQDLKNLPLREVQQVFRGLRLVVSVGQHLRTSGN